MNLSDEQRTQVEQVGKWLLKALEEIAQWAYSQISRDPPGIDSSLPETGRISQVRSLYEVRQGAELLAREPAIARLVVEWQQSSPDYATFLFCRGASAGAPTVDGVWLASYLSPIGKLAEYEPGDITPVRFGGKERSARIIERQQWRPIQSAGLWDAEDCEFSLQHWQAAITSIRRFIEEAERSLAEAPLEAIYAAAERAENVLLEVRRRAIDRIALRDQPILDRYQGEVFRMPLDRRVLLIGPPGTGKTTTLIKRIAQKQALSELPTEEKDLIASLGLSERFSAQDAWAMFSPTELLMLYLRDAFNREGVPASRRQLRTWQRERRRLARDVISILRTETRGRFRLDTNTPILLTPTSQSLAELHDSFSEFHLTQITGRCQDAINAIQQSTEEESQGLITFLNRNLVLGAANRSQQIMRLFPTPSLMQVVAVRIEVEIKEWTDREANRILRARPTLLDDIRPLLTGDDQPQEDAEEDEEDGVSRGPTGTPPDTQAETNRRAASLLLRTLRNIAIGAARSVSLRDRTREVANLLGELVPPTDSAAIIGRRILLRRALLALMNAPRRWVFGVAASYARFRREHPALYVRGIDDRNEAISGEEVDVLLLVSLRNARLLQTNLRGSLPPDWLNPIRDSYIPQVYVDEATDFSAVQLAALVELSHPNLRSWFACGDFRQRITHTGISSQSELRWVENIATGTDPLSIEVRSIGITYRQSQRLKEFADAIDPDQALLQTTVQTKFPTDPAPLLLEEAQGDETAAWLASRISEIEQTLGRMPSIAIFVNGDDKIAATVSIAEGPLRDRSIEIVGCPEGRIVGDAQEVRVFDVRHIKGLEFEAVFFLGLDDFADIEPQLFHRFLYVGVTRAATYLGITCRERLPERLHPVRSLFSLGGWRE